MEFLKDAAHWVLMLVGRIFMAGELILRILLVVAVLAVIGAVAYVVFGSVGGAVRDAMRGKRANQWDEEPKNPRAGHKRGGGCC